MRDVTLRNAKATLRSFFAGQDSAYLTRVVDECRAGVFAWTSTCHCLRGLMDGGYSANCDDRALQAEEALMKIGSMGHILAMRRNFIKNGYFDREPYRRDVTLPIVLAEIRRRQRYEQAEIAREVLVDEVPQ